MTAETVSLRITLRYKDFDEFSDRFAENISSAGLFLRTRSPKPTGTKIRFELLLADGERILRGEGAVVSVRHDDRPGMALRFAALDQQSQDVVDRVVAQHGEGELAPTPLATPFRRGSSVGGAGLGKGFGGGFGLGGVGGGFGSGGGVLPRGGSSWAGRSSEPPRSPSQPVPVAPSRRGSTARPWEALDREDSQATQRIDATGLEEPATQRISVAPAPSQGTIVHEEKTELAVSPLRAPELVTEAVSATPLPASADAPPSRSDDADVAGIALSTAMTVELRPSALAPAEEPPPPVDATTVEAPRSPGAFGETEGLPEGFEPPAVDEVAPVTQVEARAVELPAPPSEPPAPESSASDAVGPVVDSAFTEQEPETIAAAARPSATAGPGAESVKAISPAVEEAPALVEPPVVEAESPVAIEASSSPAVEEAPALVEPPVVEAESPVAIEASSSPVYEEAPAQVEPPLEPSPAFAELETVEVDLSTRRPSTAPPSPFSGAASSAASLGSWDAQIPSEITSARPPSPEPVDEVALEPESQVSGPELASVPSEVSPSPALGETEQLLAAEETLDSEAAASAPVPGEVSAEPRGGDVSLAPSPAEAVEAPSHDVELDPRESAPPAVSGAGVRAPSLEPLPSADASAPRPTWQGAPAPRPSWISDLRVSEPPPAASPVAATSAEPGASTADLLSGASTSDPHSGSEEPLLVVPVEVESGSLPPLELAPPSVSEALSSAVPFEVSMESEVPQPDWALDASPLAAESEGLDAALGHPAADAESAPAALESPEPFLEVRPFSAPPSPSAAALPAWDSQTPDLAVPALRSPEGSLPTPLPREASTPRQSFPALEKSARANADEVPPPHDFSERSDQVAPSTPPSAPSVASASTRPALEVRALDQGEALAPLAPAPVDQDIEDFLGSFAPGELSSPERSNPAQSAGAPEAGAAPGSWASEIQSDNLRASEPSPVAAEPPRAPSPRRGSGLVRSESVRVAPPSPPPAAATPPVGTDALELIQAFAAEKSSPERVAPHEEETEVLQLDRVAEARARRGEREVSVRGVGPRDGGRTPSQVDFGPPPRVPGATSSVGRRPAVEVETSRVAKNVSIPAGPEPAAPDAAPVVPRRTSVPPVAGQWTDEPRRAELRGKPIVGLELGGRWARLGMMTVDRFEPLKLGGDERYFAMVALRDDGSVAVGPEALQLAAQHPDRVFSPRQLLGLVGLGSAVEGAPPVSSGPEGVKVQLLGHSYDLAHVISNLLEPLRSRIEAAVGANAARVVVSIPFQADERVKNVFRQACKRANLELVRLVTEPAAVLYAADFEKRPVDSLLTVDLDAYDLTLSVARRGRAGFGVSLGAFEPALSASRLNEAVVRFVVGELERQGEELRDDPRARARLTDAVEKALDAGPKEQNLELEVVLPDAAGGVESKRSISVPMQRVVEVTERWVQEIMTKVNEVLADAGIHPRALGAVMLAGATSRYPALVREIMAQTQIRPQDELSGPGLRVRGLAMMGQRILAEERVDRPERLSRPIGLGLPGGRYRPLVTTSDPLPSRQKRKQATTRDFQSELELMFYQGNAEQVSANNFLGSVSLVGLPKAARGEVQVEVEIEVDPDAVLIVTLSEEESGRRTRLTVPTADTPHPRVQALREQPSVVDLSDPSKAKPDKKGLIGRFFGR